MTDGNKLKLLSSLCDSTTSPNNQIHILETLLSTFQEITSGSSSNTGAANGISIEINEWLELGLYDCIFDCIRQNASLLHSLSSSSSVSSTNQQQQQQLQLQQKQSHQEQHIVNLLRASIQLIKTTDLTVESHVEMFCDTICQHLMTMMMTVEEGSQQQQQQQHSSSVILISPGTTHLLYLLLELMKSSEFLFKYFMMDMSGINVLLDLYSSRLVSNTGATNNKRYTHARRPTISTQRGSLMSPRLSPHSSFQLQQQQQHHFQQQSQSQQQQRPKLHAQTYTNLMAVQRSVKQERTKSSDFSSIYTSPNGEIPAALSSPRIVTTTATNTTTTAIASTTSGLLSPKQSNQQQNQGSQRMVTMAPLNLGNSASSSSSTSGSPASKLKIPPLSLPTKNLAMNTMTSYTRSSRRMNHDLNYVNLESLKLSIDTLRTQTATTLQLKQQDKDADKLFQSKTIVEYFGSLAAKLGELYIANDLTYLIPIKRDLDLQMSQTMSNNSPSSLVLLKDSECDSAKDDAIVHDNALSDGTNHSTQSWSKDDSIALLFDSRIANSLPVARYFVLCLLQRVTRFHLSRKVSRNPVNLLMFELNSLSAEFRDKRQIRSDTDHLLRSVKEENLNMIYDILSQYAEDVEAKYFHLWRTYNSHSGGRKIVYDPTRDRALKKFDVFLWRWTGIVEQILENEDLAELEFQLKSLSRYLYSCISRVHASQCTAVCLETLLRIQVMSRQLSHSSRGLNYSFEKPVIVRIIHHMLEIFDFVMDSPERHPLLMEFFYFNLIDNEDNFYWLREYAKFLLLNDEIKMDGQDPEQLRLRLMKHYQIIMNLFQDLGQEFLDQQQKRSKSPALTSVDTAAEEVEEDNGVMKQFDFLVNPVDGLVLHFLTKGPLHQQYAVKCEMLRLLDKIFRLPNLPFMHIESYVSTYIRYHYLNFVKLYISPATDPQTIEACTLHLNVLIAFSINKTPVTTDRFYRMKVVRFLAREINLEHEIHERLKKQKALESKGSDGHVTANNYVSDSDSDYDSESEDDTDAYTDQTDERTDDGYLDSPSSRSVPKGVPGLALKTIGQVTATGTGLNLKLTAKEEEPSSGKVVEDATTIKKPTIPPLGGIMKSNDQSPNKPLIPSLSIASKNPLKKTLSNPLITDNGSMIINTAKSSGKSTGTNRTPRQATPDDQSSIDDSDEESEPVITPHNATKSIMIPSLSIGSKKTDDSKNAIPNDDDMDDIATVRTNRITSLPSMLANKLKLKIGGSSPPQSNETSPSFMSKLQLPHQGADGKTTPGEFGRTSRSGSVQHDALPASVTDRSMTDMTETDINYGSDFEDDDEFNHSFAVESRDFVDRRTGLDNLFNDEANFFQEEKKNRKLYQDENLHVAMLGLLTSLLITKHDSLDSRYCDQFPLNKNMLNIPYMLHFHINDPANDAIIPKLHDMIMNQLGLGARILLKLLCRKLFEPQLYTVRQKRIGYGAFGDVWRCELKFKHSAVRRVAVKLLKVPTSIDGPCLLYNIFNEILIMEKFKADSRICRLYDYGLDKDYYYIVMKEYKCSLKKWRNRQKTPLALNMPLYLNVFKKLLEAFKFLSDNSVNHFDIKCDNIFIDVYDGTDEEEFYNHTTDTPSFEMAIGDFGESYVYSNDGEDDGYTTRHRGTECIKSPEMLRIEMMKNTSKFYDRRKKVGANSASDVWSLGCLFYELLSGEFLFDSTEFTNFFMQLTDESKTLISQERYMKINYNSLLMDILVYILVRDPVRRPSISDILTRFSAWQKLMPSRDKLQQMMKNGIEWEVPVIPEEEEPVVTVSTRMDDIDELYMVPLATPHTNRRKSFTPSNALRNGFSPLHMPGKLTNTANNTPVAPTRPKTTPTQQPVKSAKDKSKTEPSQSTSIANMQSYFWHKSDISFYINKATSIIKNRLYIVSEEIASDKSLLNRLGITHVINCSVSQHPENLPPRLKQKQLISKFENNFFYLNLKYHISDNPSQAYAEYLDAFEFVKDAIKKRGRVLIYSGKGLSRSGLFAVLFLMSTYNISSYEAYLSVKNHRPALRPEILTHFLHFLMRIQHEQHLTESGKESNHKAGDISPMGGADLLSSPPIHSYQKIRQVKRRLNCVSVINPIPDVRNLYQQSPDSKSGSGKSTDTIHWYQCLCGVCVVGVISPFYVHRITSSNIKDENSPLNTWPSFLQEMKLLYFYETKHLNMGFTTRDKVLLDPFDVREHSVSHQTVLSSDDQQQQAVECIWNLHKCKYCGFMVYAEKANNTQRKLQQTNKHMNGNNNNSESASSTGTPTTATSRNTIPIDQVDICINATLKTANIVTTTLANKIQDLRPSLFFKMNSS